MIIRSILLLLCVTAVFVSGDKDAPQQNESEAEIVRATLTEDQNVANDGDSPTEKEASSAQKLSKRVDAELDQLALESTIQERDSGGGSHGVHVPPPAGFNPGSSGGVSSEYGPPRPPKGGPRGHGPIPVPYSVPVRPGTVVLPQAPNNVGGGYGGGGGAGGGVSLAGSLGGFLGNGGKFNKGKPKPSYGPPPPRPRPRPRPVYAPPKPSYGPPKPKPSYGAPKPKPSYGPPKPKPSYGVPKPKPSYGVPKPKPSYGVPKPNYGLPQKPKPSYGPPPKPRPSYGPPQKPRSNYGPPPRPQPNYAPPSNPQPSYGPPQTPAGNYGPPSKPSGQYGAPSNAISNQSGGHSSGSLHGDGHSGGTQHSGSFVAPAPHSNGLNLGSVEQSYNVPQPAQTYQPSNQLSNTQQTNSLPTDSYQAPSQPEQSYQPAPQQPQSVGNVYNPPQALTQPQDNYQSGSEVQQQRYQAPSQSQGQYQSSSDSAESWPAPVGDMPQITSLDVQCDKDQMIVSLAFDRPFNGVVFSKGHFSDYNCVHLRDGSGRNNAQFQIGMNSCGTTGNVDSGPGNGYGGQSSTGTYFENTIIIQYDPQVQEVWDQARKLRCTWHNQYEKSVTFKPFQVDTLDVVRADFAGDNVGCWMQIQVGKGPWASEVSGLVKIGQTMTMVLAIKDDENKFDMLVRNCMAHDGKRAPIQLVDENGCVARPKLMSKFSKIKNFGASASVLSYAHFQAFKFPDSMEVHFQCTIQICRNQCPDQCSNSAIQPRQPGGETQPQTYGRSRRSAVDSATDVGINRIIQVVSARDFAFALETSGNNTTETVVVPVKRDDNMICMSTPGFAALLVILLAVLIVSCILSAFLCVRYRTFVSDKPMMAAFENPIFLQRRPVHFKM